MKKILGLLLLCGFISVPAIAQKKKTNPAAGNLSAKIKSLPNERLSDYRTILAWLDRADSKLVENKNSQEFFDNVKEVYDLYQKEIVGLPPDNLKSTFTSLILYYIDASILLNVGQRLSDGEMMRFSTGQRVNLGAMQKRYNKLLNIPLNDDLLAERNVAKIYFLATKTRNSLQILFN